MTHIFNKNRKYQLNETFFDNINEWDQRQAYFLGWLASDGHVNVTKGTISIKIQEKDKEVLLNLKNLISYEGPLLYCRRKKINELISKNSKTWQNRWALTITSRYIVTQLQKLGFSSNKTDNYYFPSFLKKSLIPHFLRGFYEGDGTISYSFDKKRILFEIHLVGTPQICEKVGYLLNKNLEIKTRTINDGLIQNGNLILKFSGNYAALLFFNYIYKDAQIVLKRKFRKFLRLINYKKRKIIRKNIVKETKVLKESIILGNWLIKNTSY